MISEFLQKYSRIPVVLDTVLRATSGLELLEARIPMLPALLPLATVVTWYKSVYSCRDDGGFRGDDGTCGAPTAKDAGDPRGAGIYRAPHRVAFDGTTVHHFKSRH